MQMRRFNPRWYFRAFLITMMPDVCAMAIRWSSVNRESHSFHLLSRSLSLSVSYCCLVCEWVCERSIGVDSSSWISRLARRQTQTTGPRNAVRKVRAWDVPCGFSPARELSTDTPGFTLIAHHFLRVFKFYNLWFYKLVLKILISFDNREWAFSHQRMQKIK